MYMDDKSKMLLKKGSRRSTAAAEGSLAAGLKVGRASRAPAGRSVPGRLASLVKEQRARSTVRTGYDSSTRATSWLSPPPLGTRPPPCTQGPSPSPSGLVSVCSAGHRRVEHGMRRAGSAPRIFVFGLTMPNGPVGVAIVEKVEDFVVGMLLPLFFAMSGLCTDTAKITSTPAGRSGRGHPQGGRRRVRGAAVRGAAPLRPQRHLIQVNARELAVAVTASAPLLRAAAQPSLGRR
ncbi:unnamed protein product [Miscanthus lutarioriparius]|uniref:Cation/H+ exchanger domain-containing protein n=1 Tax=Miscanthus lutarioriparius TaxID=422564 RepID=A0A811RAX2_9POAL|nr:unnamed protein product [Miscanthus lutarioriparius]